MSVRHRSRNGSGRKLRPDAGTAAPTSKTKPTCSPYECTAGHWHLTHTQAGWKRIDPDDDTELAAIATQAAARYSDTLIAAQGWTRAELVDAIHTRLRNKYIQMRDRGELQRGPDGRIHLTEETH